MRSRPGQPKATVRGAAEEVAAGQPKATVRGAACPCGRVGSPGVGSPGSLPLVGRSAGESAVTIPDRLRSG